MKYSFIVPVYNMENYLPTCIDSLLKQTYPYFEIILINDGSTDHSMEIIREYRQKYPDKIIVIDQENKGLSMARNNAFHKVTGDYFFFVDADDTVMPNLLESIEKDKEEVDLYKFGYKLLYPSGEIKEIITHYNGKVVNGSQAIQILIQDKNVFEMAVLYGYKTTFYKNNQFSFIEGKYHEDFGLIPYIILQSKAVKLMDETFYVYVQTENSITRNENYSKTVKRVHDIFYYYETVKEKVEHSEVDESTKKIFYSFLANAVLSNISVLKGKDRKEYKKKIRKNNVTGDLLTDTWKRKIKKIRKKIEVLI